MTLKPEHIVEELNRTPKLKRDLIMKMMEVMLAKKKPMSELAAPLKIYPQVLENVRVTDKKAAQNDPAVQEAVN